MSDFGADTGNASVIVISKVMEAMMRLMEKVYQTWKEAPDRKLKSQQIKDLKSKRNIEKARESLSGRAGYIRLKLLKKANVPLRSFGIEVSSKDMRAFSELCRREDVVFSGITYKSTDPEKKQYKLICKEEDLGKIEQIVKRLNYEKQIETIENRISDIRDKSELTEQDQTDIDHLEKEQEKIKSHVCQEMNRLTKEKLVEQVFSGKLNNVVAGKEMTFDDALNRATGKGLDKDVHTIVADVADPDKIVRCHSYNAEFNGQKYIKTDYEVYVNNKKIYSCNDGRYDNRKWSYWADLKRNMQQAGHFSDTMLKFYRQEDYEHWAEKVRKQREIEVQIDGKQKKIEELQKQLQEKGCRYEEGIVYQNEIPIENDTTDLSKKMENGEMVLIGKQIQNIERLEGIEQEITNLKAEEILAEEGSEKQIEISEKIKRLEKQQQDLKEDEKNLMELRKEIIAVKIQEDLEKNPVEKDKASEQEHSQMDETMEKYQGEIAQERKRDEKGNSKSKKLEKKKEQRSKE